jgi:hypothetical protein
VSGLGNEDLTATVNATGIATVECTNPAANVAPGQDSEVDASGTVSGIEPTNGRATFTVVTATPTVTSAEAWPNPKWSARVKDVDFSSATLTLIQGDHVIFSGPLAV